MVLCNIMLHAKQNAVYGSLAVCGAQSKPMLDLLRGTCRPQGVSSRHDSFMQVGGVSMSVLMRQLAMHALHEWC
jgi:hypothetical protein